MPILYLNGKFVEHLDASLDPLDRGVLLGDGLFETIRCEEGQLVYHVAHFSRLARSARVVEIPWNMPPEQLVEICHQVLDANNHGRARLRITLTRGELAGSPEIGGHQSAPTLIVHAQGIDQDALDAARRRGWSARVVSFPLNHRSPLSEVKSTSYQERVLARHVARRDGMDEGLMLNTDGLLAEGAMSNLFIVRGGTVYTPPVCDGALPGIVRLKVGLICARLGIGYEEVSLTLENLHAADEAFMTNAIIEVMPLASEGGRPIGSGNPGPLTERLFAELRRDVDEYLSARRRG